MDAISQRPNRWVLEFCHRIAGIINRFGERDANETQDRGPRRATGAPAAFTPPYEIDTTTRRRRRRLHGGCIRGAICTYATYGRDVLGI